jgi:cysteine desulfurase
VDVDQLKVDLLSLSGHKIYGPKGIGALFVSRHCPTPIAPLILGGAQQAGLRAGTVPTFLCVGLGKACGIASVEMADDWAYSGALRDSFLEALRARISGLAVNGSLEHGLAGTLNLRFTNTDADSLLAALRGRIAASTGSACNSGIIEPSYVLLALGLSPEQANRSIRFGFGRFSTRDEVVTAASTIADKVARLERAIVSG